VLKILNIVPSYFPAKIYGGVIFSSHHTNLELSKKYKEIKICVSTTTANGSNRLYNKSTIKKFKHNYIINYYFDEIIDRFSFDFLIDLRKNIKASDIIHFQDIFSFFSITGIIFAQLFGKKILISPRGVLNKWSLNSKKTFLKKIIFFIFFKNKKFFWHATSIIEKNDLHLLDIKKNIFVVPNLILKPDFISKKNLINKNNNNFVIGCLSRFDKKKGMEYLVRSLPFLDKKFILILAGPDYGYRAEIINIVNSLNLNNRVFIFNFLDKKMKESFFNTIDLFALPSFSENFGNVFLESLQRGKPILTSFNTPFQDVEKNNCGVVVKLVLKDIIFKIAKIQKMNKLNLKNNSLKYAEKFNKQKITILYKKMYDQIHKQKY
jgi:glycosyltransferase involved in cell wall biosynthesis